MLSSEDKALAGIALPQAFGVGFYCILSAERGRFSACFLACLSCLVHCSRFQSGKRTLIDGLAHHPYSSLLKCGLFPYLIRNIPVRFLLWYTKWHQATGQGPTAVCSATWTAPSCAYKAGILHTCSKSGISLKKEFFMTPSSAVSGKMGAKVLPSSFWCFYST